MQRTDVREVGHQFGLAMAGATVAFARLNIAMLERQPWNMNTAHWNDAKAKSRKRLDDALTRLHELQSRSSSGE